MLKLLKSTTFLAFLLIQITIPQCSSGHLQNNEFVCKNQAYITSEILEQIIEKASKRQQQLKETCLKDEELYRDCAELFRHGVNLSGVYKIQPTFWRSAVKVSCDMTTDGGGWTVFQRRVDIEPREDFYRDWDDYKKGFGKLDGEFWLGNDLIFILTNQENMTLRVDLEDYENNKAFAVYDHFRIRPEPENYRLMLGAYVDGNAGDGLTNKSKDMDFSTKDRNNDVRDEYPPCAEQYRGAWWFGNCHDAELNGFPYKGEHTSFGDGINWDPFKGSYYSLKHTEMKIRPSAFKPIG